MNEDLEDRNHYLIYDKKWGYIVCATSSISFSPHEDATHIFKLPKDPNDIKVRIEL